MDRGIFIPRLMNCTPSSAEPVYRAPFSDDLQIRSQEPFVKKADNDNGKTKRNRPDHDGTHRLAFERAKKRILASESFCGICGLPVDKSLKYPDPMSPSIDHIIPIDRGGHPSDISNLQLAHWKCNRMKANKLIFPPGKEKKTESAGQTADNSNRVLPLSMNWSEYHGTEQR